MTVPLKLEILGLTLWSFIGLFIFMLRILNYFVKRRQIIQSMCPSNTPATNDVMYSCMRKLNLKGCVTLYRNSTGGAPFTTGIGKPIIAIPENFNSSEFELVLCHELCHIKNRDNIYSFIRLFTLSLYWFNPLFYVMDYYIEKTAE